ncbi:MAG: 50S ribosomal protein L3 [Asgard group archaeon]|nr:50S ribosomal protein L3 [Asgard group archaeon]
MGKRTKSAPHQGSLSFRRVRVKTPKGKIRSWPDWNGKPRLLGYAGFKAGMTHLVIVENRKHSQMYNQERIVPVTILECPPLKVIGLRGYKYTPEGLQILGEAFIKDLPQILDRKMILPDKKKYDAKSRLKTLQKRLGSMFELRVIVMTNPQEAKLPRKKPDILELKVGCKTIEEGFEYAKSLLGKDIPVDTVFEPGEYVDTIGVTKGKGIQGPVKRFGIKILPRKTRGVKRKPGALGPWSPSQTMYTVAHQGQHGYHQRTEYNKLIMKVGTKEEEITPAGGFKKYGIVTNDFLLVKGSVQGTPKRLITMRTPIRGKEPREVPEIVHISRTSQN